MEYESFAVIVTAVEIEAKSVLSSFAHWRKIRTSGDDKEWFETSLAEESGAADRKIPASWDRIITAQQDGMGMTAATMLAMKAVYEFRPRYLVMSGIAAGIGDEWAQMYGDVIVPDMIWDYSAGKYVSPDDTGIRFGTVGFRPRPVCIETDPEVLSLVRSTIGAPDNEYHVHIGPLACGSCVVANDEIVEKQIRPLFPRTEGLDMESYSIYYVAEHSTLPRPKAIVAKSICDFADSRKDDRFQKFAAYNSAQYVKYLLRKARDAGMK